MRTVLVAGANETATDRTRAYTLFAYLAGAFAGQAWPAGALPRAAARAAKGALYGLVFSLAYVDGDVPTAQSVGSDADAADPRARGGGRLPYPYLRLLLHYDPSELVRTLGVAFQDADLEGLVPADPTAATTLGVGGATLDRQAIVDMLLRVLTHTEGEFAVRTRPHSAVGGVTHQSLCLCDCLFLRACVCGHVLGRGARGGVSISGTAAGAALDVFARGRGGVVASVDSVDDSAVRRRTARTGT
jgi:hypothetical protein